jgi:hypothetical protein
VKSTNKWVNNQPLCRPLAQKNKMQTLNVKEMESSSNIDLGDVLWWMYIKDACRLGALVIAKLSKKGASF